MNQKARTVKYAVLAVAASAVIGAAAITQAEWEADHSLIPTPSASSAFYVVSPTARIGEQTVTADTVGIDATCVEREYELSFNTALKTYPCGAIMVIR